MNMKALNRRRALGRLALVTGLVGIVGLPVACGGGDSKNNSGNNGGQGGQGGTDASSGGQNTAGFFVTGGSSGSDSGATDACGNSTLQATTKPVNILLVVDRSGSMTQSFTGSDAGGQDKWTAMTAAVTSAVTATAASINYGLELFPYGNVAGDGGEADDCAMPAVPGIQVPIQAGTTALPKINTELALAPDGNTPTEIALDRALTYYTTGAGASLTGDKFVLLATDGGPNCGPGVTSCTATTCTTNLDGQCKLTPSQFGGNCCDPTFGTTLNPAVARCLDDAGTIAKITALATAGIKTIVVGIPGSDVYSTTLDAMATAGGAAASTTSPMYYKVDATGGAGALTTTLTNITKNLVTTCTLNIQNLSPDVNRDDVHVVVNFGGDDIVVPQVTDGGSGFVLDLAAKTVTLTGTYCDQVTTAGAQSVRVVLGCLGVR